MLLTSGGVLSTKTLRLSSIRNLSPAINAASYKGVCPKHTPNRNLQPSSRTVCLGGGASALHQICGVACRASGSSGPGSSPQGDENDDLGEFENFEVFMQGNQQANLLGPDELGDEAEHPYLGLDLDSITQGFQAGPDDQDGDVEQMLARFRDGEESGAGAASSQHPFEGDGGSSEGKYPDTPIRAYFLGDLFGKAAYLDAAFTFEQSHPELIVYGLQSNPDEVILGDLYCCSVLPGEEDKIGDIVSRALENGAAALLLPIEAVGAPGLPEVPDCVAVHHVMSVEEVAQRLAVAFYDAPSRDLLTVAVAGSRGKTTVSWLVRGILEELEQLTGMIGSVEYALAEDRLDVDGGLWEPDEEDPAADRECSAPFRLTPYAGKYTVPGSTPSGLNLQKLLAGMRDRGAGCAVVECSNEALASGHLDWLDVSVAVHTNLLEGRGLMQGGASTTGMPYSPTMGGLAGAADVAWGATSPPLSREQALEAQLRVFDKLKDESSQIAVINLDDPAADLVRARCAGVPVVTYGIDNESADVVAESASFSIWESELIIRTPAGRLQIITPLIGKINAYNVLAAVATGIALKVPLKAIVAGIEAVEVIPGRCEIIDEGQPFSVVVDAADTPEALDALLASFSGKANRIFTVFGAKGGNDRSRRPLMGEVAHAKSDFLIITNDSPRLEDPCKIVQDIVAGLPDDVVNKYSGYVYFPFQDQGNVPLWFEPYLQKAQRDSKRYIMEDRFSAIRAAIGTAGPDDVVIIAGRGHTDFMEYGDEQGNVVRGWFDDRVECRNALQKLTYLSQLPRLSRKTLPWGNALDEMESLISLDKISM